VEWLLKILRTVVQRRPEFSFHIESYPDNSPIIWISGEPEYFSDDCIFDGIGKAEEKDLLEFFVSEDPSKAHVDWACSCELSKLFVKEGHLIAPLAEAAVNRAIDNWFGTQQLWLSYLGRMREGETLAIKMLEVVEENFRDGLFLGCFHLNTKPIFEKLENCFLQWTQEEGWGTATGEIRALRYFIDRWQSAGYRPSSRLKEFVMNHYRDVGAPAPGN